MDIVNYCIIGALLLLLLLVATKPIRNRMAKSVVIQAAVADKHQISYTKYTPVPEQATDYILVFISGGKKINFTTNEWNYAVIQKGEHGILKYRGSHFISFEPKKSKS